MFKQKRDHLLLRMIFLVFALVLVSFVIISHPSSVLASELPIAYEIEIVPPQTIVSQPSNVLAVVFSKTDSCYLWQVGCVDNPSPEPVFMPQTDSCYLWQVGCVDNPSPEPVFIPQTDSCYLWQVGCVNNPSPEPVFMPQTDSCYLWQVGCVD